MIIATSTLSITRIFEGEYVISGGEDGQTWIATCVSEDIANKLVRALGEYELIDVTDLKPPRMEFFVGKKKL